MMLRAWLLSVVLFIPGAALAQHDEARTLVYQGIDRHYVVHLPAVPTPVPLVVGLHGQTQPIDNLRDWFHFDAIADREGFAMAYPEAVEGRWSYWSGADVYVPGRDSETVDDTGFISAMVQELVADGTADAARIFVFGQSRGSSMTWTLVCQRAELFAAAAPLSAGMTDAHLAACSPKRLIPIVEEAGVADPVMAYDGWINKPPTPRLLSVPETMEFWRRLHGCSGQESHMLPHRVESDPARTVRVAWTGCSVGGPLVLYKVIGGGHQPPSFTPATDEQRRFFGRRGQDVEMAEAMWAFFRAAE